MVQRPGRVPMLPWYAASMRRSMWCAISPTMRWPAGARAARASAVPATSLLQDSAASGCVRAARQMRTSSRCASRAHSTRTRVGRCRAARIREAARVRATPAPHRHVRRIHRRGALPAGLPPSATGSLPEPERNSKGLRPATRAATVGLWVGSTRLKLADPATLPAWKRLVARQDVQHWRAGCEVAGGSRPVLGEPES